jgi:predicted aconitase with swiveling domain
MAMIVTDVEPILLGSAVLKRNEKKTFEAIRSGDFVKVDANKGSVTVTRN